MLEDAGSSIEEKAAHVGSGVDEQLIAETVSTIYAGKNTLDDRHRPTYVIIMLGGADSVCTIIFLKSQESPDRSPCRLFPSSIPLYLPSFWISTFYEKRRMRLTMLSVVIACRV